MTDYPATLSSRRLRVSGYDRAWSWLLALLLFIGTAVFILFMVWLSNQIRVTDIAREVDLTEVGDGEGGGDGRPSGGTQLESPDVSAEPLPITDTAMTDVQDSLAAVAETVVEQAAMLDDPALQPPKAKGDYGTGGGSGGGSGPGRGLGHGKGRPGRPQRWELRFDKGQTLESYARQLDFFEIELGVIVEGNKVIYLSKFSAGIPTRREVAGTTDKRYYFVWQGGGLKDADLEFFRRARVSTESGTIFMFIPPKWEQELLKLEREKNGKPISEIKRTRFGILSAGAGFKFYVIDQMLK
ncbi:MAG: hypothetical protein IT426_01415 [Pirellulales bacterium]|nr:hypothetical protein [Pirellulales bacterium]